MPLIMSDGREAEDFRRPFKEVNSELPGALIATMLFVLIWPFIFVWARWRT
jgi:hypothetical protein